MASHSKTINSVSDTAYWVAHYRAVESSRPDALFHDPYAALLIGERGTKISNTMANFAKYAYWSVTIRTTIIDEYILKYLQQGYDAIINLGAGLDTRPYRLDLSPNIKWVEIDFPEIIALKNSKLKDENPNCNLERIGLNLADIEARKKLFSTLNAQLNSAIILTEGVVPYLDEIAVASLASNIEEQPNFKLWINEYYSPEVYPRYQSQKFKDSLGDSPFRFFPCDWFTFFAERGWKQKEIKYLYDEAMEHNREFPLPRWVRAFTYIFGKQRFQEKIRKYAAYIVFEKNRA